MPSTPAAAAANLREGLAIEIKGLSVAYGNQRAVDSIDLEVFCGEVVGFLGPNGAGKTTTMRALLDLLRPDAGTLRVFGEDPRKAGGALRARLGFLPGDLALFPGLSGRQNLDLFANLYGGRSQARDAVLERLGFRRDALDWKLRKYSTGMRQMIGIAVAFQHEPDLLVLDEPTTGLDPLVREAFLQLIRDRASAGRTVLFSSHVLAEVEDCADRVALIDRGRLLAVEDMETFRRRLPRKVILRRANGEVEVIPFQGSPRDLVQALENCGLDDAVDVEVRPAVLNEVFRAIIREGQEDSP
ncbi:MAG: ABC transporter ATP-binding protein [Planctomycetota bacterium]